VPGVSITSAMKLDDAFNLITTLVESKTPQVQSRGTGFFYQKFGPLPNPGKTGAQWYPIEGVWLVTNRHVLAPTVLDKELFPTEFSFHLRRIDGGKMHWDPITLSREQILKRARFHRDSKVDVCTIDVLDLLEEKMKTGNYLQWYGVSKENFSGQNEIQVEVADDVVIIGHPHGIYDELNLFPIVKSGIIASRWGAKFNGEPYFFVDAKLFPGSSGSIVLSKPKDLVVKNRQFLVNPEKQFAFLGIYSGDFIRSTTAEFEDMTITVKSPYNLIKVWYADLVEDIIQNGQSYSFANEQ
jgi:hypothetical protein